MDRCLDRRVHYSVGEQYRKFIVTVSKIWQAMWRRLEVPLLSAQWDKHIGSIALMGSALTSRAQPNVGPTQALCRMSMLE